MSSPSLSIHRYDIKKEERDRERDRETETERQRQRDRETETERDRISSSQLSSNNSMISLKCPQRKK